MSCVAVLAVPAALGLDRLLVREIAVLQTRGDWAHVKGLLRRSQQLVLGISIVIAAMAVLAFGLFYRVQDGRLIESFQIGMVLVPLIAFARLRQAALQGFGRVVAGQVPEGVVQPAIVMLLAAAVTLVPPEYRNSQMAMTIQVIASVTACVLGVAFLRRSVPPQLDSTAPRYLTGAWSSAGLHFMWLVGMTAVLTNADTILVGLMASPEQAGLYRVASQLAMFVGLPLTAISVAIAPGMASMHATGRIDELRIQCRAAARLVALTAGGIAFVIAIAGREVLRAFGPEFGQAFTSALALSAAYLFHSAMATSGYLLIMSGHERLVASVFTVGALANVLGVVILVPSYGLLGAATATGISLCMVSATCAVFARRLTGVNATLFSVTP
jgi:O-antigen/teichoic acid export membrane protein